jgi:ribosomal protein S18 acetylase RimI-like enzyme
MSESLKFVEVTDINDGLLLHWLDLYEASFPPEEKVPVSWFLNLLKLKANGERQDSHIVAALTPENHVVGLLRFDIERDINALYLWYIAVDPAQRNRGIGTECFAEVLRQAKQEIKRAVIFEVEIPEEFTDYERIDCAERRIEFYRRQGAHLLKGIRYVHSVGHYQPEILMHIMVCPLLPLTPVEAFEIAKALFEDGVTQIGQLVLE